MQHDRQLVVNANTTVVVSHHNLLYFFFLFSGNVKKLLRHVFFYSSHIFTTLPLETVSFVILKEKETAIALYRHLGRYGTLDFTVTLYSQVTVHCAVFPTFLGRGEIVIAFCHWNSFTLLLIPVIVYSQSTLHCAPFPMFSK